ncbi:hypothetical protein [Thalassoroseus pseudoceratinae]|uniref:hypothetical protein n=1 Tax=Thalassoroseus pseudoceratinae TaxID=2713176 RepID=UPI001422C0B2|nr:hypothetical protein [Thalassoroseus pseudoceratinae]
MFLTRIERHRIISFSLATAMVCGTFWSSVMAQTLPPQIAVPAPDEASSPQTIDDEAAGVVELAPPATPQPTPPPQMHQQAPPMHRPAPTPYHAGYRPQPYSHTVEECPAPRSIFHLMPTPRECVDGLVENYHEKKAYPTYFDDYLRNCFLCCCPWCPSRCKTAQEIALEKGESGFDIHCQIDLPKFGSSRVTYPTNPYYFDPRDGKIYGAQGYGMPVGMPLAPNVEHTYNYSHGTPASRLTPISRQTAQP